MLRWLFSHMSNDCVCMLWMQPFQGIAWQATHRLAETDILQADCSWQSLMWVSTSCAHACSGVSTG